MHPPSHAVHLGDGAYVSFDQWSFWLWAEREDGWHYVVLEPDALTALNQYAERHLKA